MIDRNTDKAAHRARCRDLFRLDPAKARALIEEARLHD